MPNPVQLQNPGAPKPRGGARPGAGRKKTAPDTIVIRVCAAIADDCRALDDDYRRRYAEARELGGPVQAADAS